MSTQAGATTYDVTYRATVAGGGQAEIRLRTTSACATLADAWGQLTALHHDVDPRSIEIELRERAAPLPKRGENAAGHPQRNGAVKPE